MPETLREITRGLSEIYDKDSKDTFISLYLGKGFNNKFIVRRENEIKKLLKNEEHNNFIETLNQIREILQKNKNKNIAIFASKKNNFLKYYISNVEFENLLIVDSSPYIRPLARINDEWESFTFLLINTNYAKIFSVSMGEIDDTKKLSADIMSKHKKGGWSQARFNRIRKGAIDKFYSDVIDELQKRVDEQIIIAGPGTAKNHLADKLPQHLKEKLVDIIDISIDDENKLLKESIEVISNKEKTDSIKAVKFLKSEILKDGLAVYGIEETLKAVKNGQVELLIIEKDKKIKGWICEKCQVIKTGSNDKCPYCSGPISEVDVLEEILEFAERTDAKIEFTEDEEIANLGHIGAILRYK